MKLRRKFITLLLVLALAVMYAPGALAQDGDPADPILPCEGEGVAGTVIDVDTENGVVTVYTQDGVTCTVTLNGSYDHPIVTLLGRYFGDISADSFEDALSDTQGCVLQDTEDGTWSWVDCNTTDSQEARIISENEDGTFNVLLPDGTVIILSLEGDLADQVSNALAVLGADWILEEGGDLKQVSDQVAEYHDNGMGFGVLVKLYALAYANSGVTVQELVDDFKSGTGMGQLFKEYGKPDERGVGHLRQKDKDKAPDTSLEDPTQDPSTENTQTQGQPADKGKDKSTKANKGVCNARANGGNANAKGKGVTCSTNP